MRAGHEKMKDGHEKVKAMMEVWLEETNDGQEAKESCLGKTEAMIRVDHEEIEPKLRLAWKKLRPLRQRPIKKRRMP
jgi:hypothetical protein